MGTIKDRNGMDLTEAEIVRRAGKNTQKNYIKKIFTTQIIMTLYRRQGSRPSPWKRNAKKQNGCLGRPYK